METMAFSRSAGRDRCVGGCRATRWGRSPRPPRPQEVTFDDGSDTLHWVDALTHQLLPYFRALAGESDRGIVILSAAHLDDRLKDLLTAFFVDSPKAVQDLLENDGPVATFSARTRLAFCLGLLTDDERADLDLIRRTRNEAAHLATKVDFGVVTSPITQRCGNFRTLSERTMEGTTDARDRFMLVVAWLAVKIAHVRESVTRCSPPAVPENITQLATRAIMLSAMTQDFAEHGTATPAATLVPSDDKKDDQTGP